MVNQNTIDHFKQHTKQKKKKKKKKRKKKKKKKNVFPCDVERTVVSTLPIQTIFQKSLGIIGYHNRYILGKSSNRPICLLGKYY